MLSGVLDFLLEHWELTLALLLVAEKAVLLTKSKADDYLVAAIKHILGLKRSSRS